MANENKMIKIKIDKEAQSFIKTHQIKTLSIYVDKIPCGCVRPKEVTKAEPKKPKNISLYSLYKLNNLDIYLKKDLKIPDNKIEIKLGTMGKKRLLYPIGIEYFNGMGNYCEISL
jgi:hypothetical protein